MTSFCGSIDFLAPEMVQLCTAKGHSDKGYGKEIDIWAIGVISYVLMSAELPFSESDDDDDWTVMRQIASGGVTFSSRWTDKSIYGIVLVRCGGLR